MSKYCLRRLILAYNHFPCTMEQIEQYIIAIFSQADPAKVTAHSLQDG